MREKRLVLADQSALVDGTYSMVAALLESQKAFQMLHYSSSGEMSMWIHTASMMLDKDSQGQTLIATMKRPTFD